MLRPSALFPRIALALAMLTACSSVDEDQEPSATSSACEELLGSAGIEWLHSGTHDGESVRMGGRHSVAAASSLFRGQVENWTPGRKGIPSYAEAEVCTAAGPGGKVAIEYGPSILPFDSPITGTTGAKLIETPVSSDVRLLQRITDGNVEYVVFVTCKVPGTPAAQKNDVPLEGIMSDTLTGDASARTHFRHLLHSAQVMTDALDCENDPTVPGEPPASVK
ncbi:hypothetical protein ACIRNI_01835 [Streptomyces sp. NPDC093546]|uniref:hypothetical protein n=1 Tax=Streptomyces sp. NPDC093546 TaxID=3366040 RepID=UPI003801E824